MGITFETVPAQFGPLHIGILIAVAALITALFFVFRKLSCEQLTRLILICGICMVLAEVWKQWFIRRYVYFDGSAVWFFPWQLCSMAMYCAVAVPLLKGRAQDTLLIFLSTYSVVAAVFALLFPADMMRPQIWLFTHSFLYHALMLVIGLAAALILRKRETRPHFLPTLPLYAGMASIAEFINIIAHETNTNGHTDPNMFNITPYYPSTQPVFHDIAVKLGILPEILLYLFLIALAAYGLYRLICPAEKSPRQHRPKETDR